VWLRQHALGVAIASLLVALVSVSFAAVQLSHRPDTTPVAPATSVADDQTLAASAIPPNGAPGEATLGAPLDTRREIQRSVKVLEPAYTVKAGDTLNSIAAAYHTTVERIQAWNDLPDPRALRIGTKLVIPAAF
jgi:LysM repeat protein